MDIHKLANKILLGCVISMFFHQYYISNKIQKLQEEIKILTSSQCHQPPYESCFEIEKKCDMDCKVNLEKPYAICEQGCTYSKLECVDKTKEKINIDYFKF